MLRQPRKPAEVNGSSSASQRLNPAIIAKLIEILEDDKNAINDLITLRYEVEAQQDDAEEDARVSSVYEFQILVGTFKFVLNLFLGGECLLTEFVAKKRVIVGCDLAVFCESLLYLNFDQFIDLY